MTGSTRLPTYRITLNITGTEAILHQRGDFHYGVKGINLEDMKRELKREQDQHRGNIFVLSTGDLIENGLNDSIGHGYDIDIRDPQTQRDHLRDVYIELNKHLYGEKEWKSLKLSKTNLTGCLHVGCAGNHEYRTRKNSGLWVQRDIYGPSKTWNVDIAAIIKLKIVNKKLKMSKTYTIFLSHRPYKSNASDIASIIRVCRKKKGDVLADIYSYGHYHRRSITPDSAYDSSGNFKKVLYVINPSPLYDVEYADWGGYSPLRTGWYVNVRLPLESNKFPYALV